MDSGKAPRCGCDHSSSRRWLADFKCEDDRRGLFAERTLGPPAHCISALIETRACRALVTAATGTRGSLG
jgi:hypothetical protein